MKSLLKRAVWIGMAISVSGAPLLAQLHDNSEKQMKCENQNYNSDQARYCEIREQSLPATGRLSIDAGPNGGVVVKGWLQSGVLVRARIEASSDTETAAAAMASRVSIDGSGGQVKAIGPASADNSWWSVSYEIFVPQTSDLTIKANNGGITISDIRGQISFDGHNGGVRLRRLAGDVSGATVNGGVQVELTGAMWEGRQLEVNTHNGGVTVTVPSYYSAHIQAETGNGRIESDFPIATDNGARSKKLDLNLGSSGPLIHVTTVNGGVRLKRAEGE
jgi:hypothetical protein